MYEDFFARIKRDYQQIRALPTDKERLQFIARIVNWSTVPDSNDIGLIRNSLLRSIQGIWGADQALFAPETTKKRASGEYARISCVSVRTSGRPSPVSAAKNDTTDENGEDHIHLLDAESSPFVSSE